MEPVTKIFHFMLMRPKQVLFLGLFILILSGAGLQQLIKNTSVDAFIPEQHHSIQTRDKIKRVFGLQDPIVISVKAGKLHLFTPDTLNLVREIHNTLVELPNVSTVKSLVSEPFITGDELRLEAYPLLEKAVGNQLQAQEIALKVREMQAFIGTLVAKDLGALALIVELKDSDQADASYLSIKAKVEPYQNEQVSVHVAGQGAVSGYLSKYIDTDSKKMQPIMVATILFLLFLAFRQGRGLLAPLLIIVGSALGSIGIMAWLGVPYYAITGALPIVITSIAVADSIHVLTAYYEIKARNPKQAQSEIVKAAMLDMYLPVTLTTLTTIAGFIGLSMASLMPPIKYFGLFASVGVLLAWFFSMTVLPALLLLLNPPPSRVFRVENSQVSNKLGVTLARIALFSYNNPRKLLVFLLVLFAYAAFVAGSVRIDRSQIENFKQDEPIRLAHQHINQDYAGSAYLDIMFSTPEPDGLLEPTLNQKISQFQDYLESLPYVGKTLSINDYLARLHQVINQEQETHRHLTVDDDTLAQYLLLYESSSDISDFSDEIDNQYQQMLVRAYLHSDYFSQEKQVVEQVQQYLKLNFDSEQVQAELGGRVNIRYHWMTKLGQSHFLSLVISLCLVTLIASLLFRSFYLGVTAAMPVLFTITVMYAVMSQIGIVIEPATSMFAAIAIGVGIDFPIHFLERLQQAQRQGLNAIETMTRRFPGATRACYFNAAALACGFATLFFSELPTLHRFGLMITLACIVSFFCALLLIPLAWRFRQEGMALFVKATKPCIE